MRSGCLPPFPAFAQSSTVEPVMATRNCASPAASGRCRRAIPAPGAGRHCRRRRPARDCQLLAQLGQEFGRFRQRLHRVEGIEQPALVRGARHELRDALRALAAARHRSDRIGAKAALLPDHAGEKFQRQADASPPTRSSGTSPRAHRSPAPRPPALAAGSRAPSTLDWLASSASSAQAGATEDKSDTVQHRARRNRPLCMAVAIRARAWR